MGVQKFEQIAVYEMTPEEKAANAAAVKLEGRGLLMDSFSVTVTRPIPKEPE